MHETPDNVTSLNERREQPARNIVQNVAGNFLSQKYPNTTFEATACDVPGTLEFEVTESIDRRAAGNILAELNDFITDQELGVLKGYTDDSINSLYENPPKLRFIKIT